MAEARGLILTCRSQLRRGHRHSTGLSLGDRLTTTRLDLRTCWSMPLMRIAMPRFALLLLAIFLPFTTGAPAAADPIESGAEHCVVNVRADDRLNLRAGPGTRAEILSRLSHNSCGVIVTGACRKSWCPVEDGHHAGRVHRHYIAAIPAAEYCFTAAARREFRSIRSWPALHSRVLIELPAEQCGIRLLPYTRDDWQKVRTAGWEGWLLRAVLARMGD